MPLGACFRAGPAQRSVQLRMSGPHPGSSPLSQLLREECICSKNQVQEPRGFQLRGFSRPWRDNSGDKYTEAIHLDQPPVFSRRPLGLKGPPILDTGGHMWGPERRAIIGLAGDELHLDLFRLTFPLTSCQTMRHNGERVISAKGLEQQTLQAAPFLPAPRGKPSAVRFLLLSLLSLLLPSMIYQFRILAHLHCTPLL